MARLEIGKPAKGRRSAQGRDIRALHAGACRHRADRRHYVSVLPQLYHDSARATARLVLKAVRATNRKIGTARET